MHTKKIDPLYTIFEQHLFNFQDPNADRKSFLEGIVKDYITHMRKLGLGVPPEWEEHIFEELFFQVNTMLVKKIYGCLTINEFIAKAPTEQKKKARTNYRKLHQATTEIEASSAAAPKRISRQKVNASNSAKKSA